MLYTIGHGAIPRDQFLSLLALARISRLIDVRAAPGSFWSPHFNRSDMYSWIRAAGIVYEWLPELGGRRTPSPTSKNDALPANVRGFADYMESASFLATMKTLLGSISRPTAIMCSEKDWRACHRRLIADAAELLFSTSVQHILHENRIEPHKRIDNPRVESKILRYDDGLLSLF